MVYFHYLTEGACKVRLADASAVLEVTAGDLVLFPQDDRHLMRSTRRQSTNAPNLAHGSLRFGTP